MSKLIQSPKHTAIENVALNLAATWYEVGRSQGLTSKFKNAKLYAQANFEKFIPKAIEHLMSMLGRQDIPDLMKEEIYDCLMERIQDPTNITSTEMMLPALDMKKLFEAPKPISQALEMKREEPINIRTDLKSSTYVNPYQAKAN